MTVYVDDMRAKFGRMVMCHMIADTDDELHAMAAAIGVARRWHQTPGPNSHYDVALSARAKAVAAGTVEITWRQAGFMTMCRRMALAMPGPDQAEAMAKAEIARRRAANETPTAP